MTDHVTGPKTGPTTDPKINSGREPQVLHAVVSLIDSLLDDFDVVDLLTDLTQQCARLLDVASAGLLLAGPGGDLHLMAATSDRTHDVEVLQLQAQEGPCLDCYHTGEPVSVADLHAEATRWPRFVAAATDAGFASVHAVPMRAAGTVIGALGLFGTATGSLDPADLDVGQTLAHIATVAILQEHAPTADTVALRLHRALQAQVVVEQAKGVVRARLGITLEDALQLLRGYARSHHQHLSNVCAALMTNLQQRDLVVAELDTLHRSVRA